MPIYENSAAAGGTAAVDVPPTIAHEKTFAKIEVERFGRAQDHSRLWLVTMARIPPISAGVPADFHPRNLRQGLQHFPVNRIDRGTRLRPARDIRLVGHDDEEIAGRLEASAASRDVFINFEIVYRRRRVGPAVADNRLIDNAVAIQKDRAPRYFVLSHFVCATFSFGWLTKRCHTTAWNASECGVMLFAFTVGITMTTSATFAV